MDFEGQKPDEEIIFIEKQHPAVIFRVLIALTILTLLPIIAYIFFKFSSIFFYAFFFWLVIVLIYGFRSWYCFVNSKYILTTKRLISIQQKGSFYKIVSEAQLSKIQDVSFEIRGFWSSMFDFGTVYFQTAGKEEKIKLANIEEPKRIQSQILDAVRGVEKGPENDEKEEKDKKESKVKKTRFWD